MSDVDQKAAAMGALRAEAMGCTRCALYQTGLPVVWGEGNPAARVVIVGQGPGEQEVQQGRLFVGPAGALLDRALAEAGIDRRRLWLTNALKHWATTVNPRGTVVSRPPRAGELRACHHWLAGELAIARPRLVVCLGGPAAQSFLGRAVAISEARGRWFAGPDGEETLVSLHPSYVLRLRGADPDAYRVGWSHLVDDLRSVAARAAQLGIAIGLDGQAARES